MVSASRMAWYVHKSDNEFACDVAIVLDAGLPGAQWVISPEQSGDFVAQMEECWSLQEASEFAKA